MSDVILCDRRGGKVPRRGPRIVRGALQYDLCKACLASFDKEFMANKAIVLERFPK